MSQLTFKPRSHTVSDLVGRLARHEKKPSDPIFIPSLQREYCWDHQQIEALFDSLLRNLPLGSLLLWRVTGDQGRDEALYQFITNYVGESAYPSGDKHDADGVWVLNKSLKAAPDGTSITGSYSLALDGQQRLTSLLIGLHGTHYLRKRQKWKNKRASYTRRKLHLDLLAHPNRKVEDESLRYQFQFKHESSDSRTEKGAYWWPVSNLSKDAIGKVTDELQDDLAESETEAEAIESNLSALRDAVFEREHLVVEGIRNLSSRIAVDLFVRRNDGGEQLSNADIAFSQIAVYWELAGQDPKGAFEDYLTDLNGKWAKYGFSFGKGFIIRALLVLGGYGPTLRRENLVPHTIRELEPIWENLRRRDDVAETYRIISEELGLGDKCIASYKAALPILYFCHQHRREYGDDSQVEDPAILQKMDYWLATVTCNQLFTHFNSNRLLKEFCNRITEDSFPVFDLLADYDEPDLPVHLDEDRLSNLVQSTDFSSGARKHFLLTRLYDGDRISGTLIEEGEAGNQWQVDHIFPRGRLDSERLRQEVGLNPDAIEKCGRYKNRLANLQLISENQSKKDKDPGDWLRELAGNGADTGTRKTQHHLPDWPLDAYNDYSRFPKFCDEREKLILKRLNGVLPLYETLTRQKDA